jgi:lipopolysaccharide transport system permease protein
MHARLALLRQLVQRELQDRYRGSLLGFAWAFLLPLGMVAIYTFVFGFVFDARWGAGGSNPFEFAVFLYCGLVPYQFLADALSRAPGLLFGYAALVKKVAFPLPLLAVAATLASAIHMLIGFVVLMGFAGLALDHVPMAIVLAPIAALPLLLFALGAVLMLSSASVFFRDLSQVVLVLLPALLFLSPVFYPVSAVPDAMQAVMRINPLSGVIENVRALVTGRSTVDIVSLALTTLAGGATAALGAVWFRRLQPGFADAV